MRTISERAAMVKDLEGLADTYADAAKFDRSNFMSGMCINYRALASALKQGLTFEAVA